MTDEELKVLFQEAMEYEAERIMEIVNADPALKDVQAPPEIRENLFAQIAEYEEQKRLENLSEEDREWIRLGKIYRKRRKWNRYIVLAAALVAVLALGTVSIGEDKNILSIFKKMVAGEEMTEIDSDSIEPTVFVTEEEVYEEIEKTYDFSPIKLEYIPKDVGFKEAVFCQDIQTIYMYYGVGKVADITYTIRPNYRESSLVNVVEDDKLQEYTMIVNGVEVSLSEYHVTETGKNRWSVLWVCQDVQYVLNITDMKQADVEEMVNTLRLVE